ncbi:hypothetical protein ACSBR2_012086 [Camellia fascicularis]
MADLEGRPNPRVLRDNWSTIHEVDYADDFLTASIDPTASSTEDAIKQVCSKRPMSQTEVPCDISSNDKQSEKEVRNCLERCKI